MPSAVPMREHFEIGDALGRGGAGAVFEARSRGDLSRVALKIANEGHDAVLLREATLHARLMRRWGPSLVAVGRDVDSGRVFLALTFTEGEPLPVAAREKRFGAPTKLALLVGHAVASALDELHEADAAHGDVTPANIIVTSRAPQSAAANARAATLIDLSLSVAIAEERGGYSRRYAPPSSNGIVSPECDVFQLGLVLAELLFPEIRDSEEPLAALAILRARDVPSEHQSDQNEKHEKRAPRERAHASSIAPALRRLVLAMTSEKPGARPPAHYVARELRVLLALPESHEEIVGARSVSIARHYLAVRHATLFQPGAVALSGPPRAWVADARSALSITENEEDVARRTPLLQLAPLTPLSQLDRARWLTRIAGSFASSFGEDEPDEGKLAERLLSLAARSEPASWTRADFDRDAEQKDIAPPSSDIDLVRALSSGVVSEVVLRAAEQRSADAPLGLVLALGERLLAMGQSARASLVLEPHREPSARALMAEALRRSGDSVGAAALALSSERSAAPSDHEAVQRARFVRARIAWDSRQNEQAMALVAGMAPADAAEIRALCHYARGEISSGAAVVQRALSHEGTSARLFGLLGLLSHADGDAEKALTAFGRAVEIAVLAGAVSDEATYRTGEAAAALDAGDVGRALAASFRAVVLCERGRERRFSPRAWLGRAGALLNAGATFEAEEALHEARARALEMGDVRCLLYAELIRIDLLAPSDPARAALAADALTLARPLGNEDTLRALVRGNLVGNELALADSLVESAGVTARLEYFRARAEASKESLQDARSILEGLLSLTRSTAPAQIRATAWDSGRELARKLGEREAMGRFEHLLFELCARVENTIPPAYRSRFLALPWVKRRGEGRGLSLPFGEAQ